MNIEKETKTKLAKTNNLHPSRMQKLPFYLNECTDINDLIKAFKRSYLLSGLADIALFVVMLLIETQ